MFIPKEILQKIDDETDILALASEFISLEKKGKNYFGLCPFHEEKTPSFSVSPEKNIAKCMGCGEGGRPIKFYQTIKNIPFVQAASELANKLGINIPNAKPIKADPNLIYYEILEEAQKFYSFNLFSSKAGHKALDYLKNRRLTEATIRHFKLGYSSSNKDQLYQILRDKKYSVSHMIKLGLVKQSNDGTYYDMFTNRIMFPVTNPQGRTVGFSGRSMDNKSNHKYINSPETVVFKKGELLYHLEEGSQSIRRRRHAVLYEGFFDVISAYQADFKNGIATMGTALTSYQANLIKKTTDKLVLAFDGDDAGRKAAIQSIKPLQNTGLIVEVLNIPEQMDPDDFIKQYGPNEYDKLFSQNALDPYAFKYLYYKENVNLSDANDISKFQKEITSMLRNANPSIQNIYIKRLAKDLDVDESIIKIPKPSTTNNFTSQPYEPVPPYQGEVASLPPKVHKKRLANKYENAERRLIFLMIRSKTWSNRINNELSIQDYAELLNGMVRTKLHLFYQNNESFNLTNFKETLNEEEVKHLEEVLFKDEFWIEQRTLTNEEILIYLSLVKNAAKIRRIAYLQSKMVRLQKEKKSYKMEYDEFVQLKLELDNLKGVS